MNSQKQAFLYKSHVPWDCCEALMGQSQNCMFDGKLGI